MRRHDFPPTAKLEADGCINLGARSEQDVEGRGEMRRDERRGGGGTEDGREEGRDGE